MKIAVKSGRVWRRAENAQTFFISYGRCHLITLNKGEMDNYGIGFSFSETITFGQLLQLHKSKTRSENHPSKYTCMFYL